MNVENLKTLADYLESLPADYEGFDMGVFCRDEHGEFIPPQAHNCGTSMCALGHGPRAGLGALDDEDWVDYGSRLFETSWWWKDMQWCFSGRWDEYYPDLKHAVKRMRYLIEHGKAPEWFHDEIFDAGNFTEMVEKELP